MVTAKLCRTESLNARQIQLRSSLYLESRCWFTLIKLSSEKHIMNVLGFWRKSAIVKVHHKNIPLLHCPPCVCVCVVFVSVYLTSSRCWRWKLSCRVCRSTFFHVDVGRARAPLLSEVPSPTVRCRSIQKNPLQSNFVNKGSKWMFVLLFFTSSLSKSLSPHPGNEGW